jgi:hypothetical protein
MLEIEVKTEAVMQRFETMTDRLKTFGNEDLPQGLTDWQVLDMHRKYPETEVIQEGAENQSSAQTMIYPRSRTYEQTHPHRMHAVAIRKPVLSSMPRLMKSVLRHPILRSELFDKLYSRMVAMLDEKIKWR